MCYIMDDGSFLTRTGAYNELKDLLGIPKNEWKKATLNGKFFDLVFQQVEGRYKWTTSQEETKEVFQKHSIPALNKEYYQTKDRNISREIMEKTRQGLFEPKNQNQLATADPAS